MRKNSLHYLYANEDLGKNEVNKLIFNDYLFTISMQIECVYDSFATQLYCMEGN